MALASAENPKICSYAEYLGPERNSEIFNMKKQRRIYFGKVSVSWVSCSLPSPHQPSKNNKTLTMLKSLVETWEVNNVVPALLGPLGYLGKHVAFFKQQKFVS